MRLPSPKRAWGGSKGTACAPEAPPQAWGPGRRIQASSVPTAQGKVRGQAPLLTLQNGEAAAGRGWGGDPGSGLSQRPRANTSQEASEKGAARPLAERGGPPRGRPEKPGVPTGAEATGQVSAVMPTGGNSNGLWRRKPLLRLGRPRDPGWGGAPRPASRGRSRAAGLHLRSAGLHLRGGAPCTCTAACALDRPEAPTEQAEAHHVCSLPRGARGGHSAPHAPGRMPLEARESSLTRGGPGAATDEALTPRSSGV